MKTLIAAFQSQFVAVIRGFAATAIEKGELGPGENADQLTFELNGIILAADTTVALGDEILGKPLDDEDARRMLQKLSGRRHEVYTGVCLRSAGIVNTRVACTGVWFDTLSPSEIEFRLCSNAAS